jgi:S-adenosylmethionine:tRNA ribosyltransferase-isomerase
MLISEFDYELPEDLIAQQPLSDRSSSRMMIVDGGRSSITDGRFVEFPDLLRAGDVVVFNNTKVFPARLFGRTETGANIEIFLVRRHENVWETLARPARRLRPGKKITFSEDLTATVAEKGEDGRVGLIFQATGDLFEILDRIGKTPLPPYIKRQSTSIDTDRDRYQTVFAKTRGAIAAPTAGLHFTPEVLDAIRERGVTTAEITLHVGYGTFEPVRVHDVDQHTVAAENYSIDSSSEAELLNAAIDEKRRIVAIGTTTTRALEHNITKYGGFTAGGHSADLTIRPGYKFKAVGALLTNFHLPASSLLVLVSAFAGREFIIKAYQHAVAERYRFYSYGDCMLIV